MGLGRRPTSLGPIGFKVGSYFSPGVFGFGDPNYCRFGSCFNIHPRVSPWPPELLTWAVSSGAEIKPRKGTCSSSIDDDMMWRKPLTLTVTPYLLLKCWWPRRVVSLSSSTTLNQSLWLWVTSTTIRMPYIWISNMIHSDISPKVNVESAIAVASLFWFSGEMWIVLKIQNNRTNKEQEGPHISQTASSASWSCNETIYSLQVYQAYPKTVGLAVDRQG